MIVAEVAPLARTPSSWKVSTSTPIRLVCDGTPVSTEAPSEVIDELRLFADGLRGLATVVEFSRSESPTMPTSPS